MFRYVVFTYDSYYPNGGRGDIVGLFKTKDELIYFLFEGRESGRTFLDTTEVLDMEDGTYQEIDWFNFMGWGDK